MKKDLIIGGHDGTFHTFRTENALPDTFVPEAGKWAGLGRNGKIYALDHVAVLPPKDIGNDGTRPDFVGAFVLVTRTVPLIENGIVYNDKVGGVIVCNSAGVKAVVSQDVIVNPINTIHGGASFKVITSGADIGKLEIASVGDSYNAITEVVGDEWLTIRIAFATVL